MRLKGGRAFELRRGAAPSLHAIALSRRKQGFESPRERHAQLSHLKSFHFHSKKSHFEKVGHSNVRHLSFAIAASASFFLRAARVYRSISSRLCDQSPPRSRALSRRPPPSAAATRLP